MSKNYGKQFLKYVTQVTKQKANIYPYYPITTKYQQNQNLFIFSVQYPSGLACITTFMITKDNTKKNGITNIEVLGINDKSAISIIQVIDFQYKEKLNVIETIQATILVGYRQGQLIIVRYKDRKTQVLHRFNKSLKKQGFFQKASNYFNSDQGYKTMIKGPIKTALYSPSRKYAVSYLAGNAIVMNKTKDQKNQQILHKQFMKISPQQSIQKGLKIVINEGLIFSASNKQICTYNYTEKQQILVAFSMQSIVSCFSSKDLSLLYSITTQMPIRKINFYSFPEGDFLTILPYQDYAILINVRNQQYIKLYGYRCFIANSVIYRSDKGQNSSLVFLSGGLDHRVCFDKIEDLKNWNMLQRLQMQSENQSIIQSAKNGFHIDEDKKGLEFSNKYSLGQYSNARTNSHDYGFSDLIFGLGLAAFPTYDGKIKVFRLNYK